MPGDTDIRAAPLRPDGSAAPGASYLVSGGKNAQGEPAAAWSGSQLLVAWEDSRDDRANADVFATRLGSAGEPLDVGARPLGVGPLPQRAPVAAWDGRTFLVVWHEGPRGLVAARVASDGSSPGPPVVVPGTAQQSFLSEPALCADGEGALLVWGARSTPATTTAREPEIRAMRIAAGAPVERAESFPLARTYDTLAPIVRVACGRQAATLVWTGSIENPARLDLHMGRLERGARAFPGGTLTLLERQASLERPAVASDGAGFLVAWRRTDIVTGTRVALYGTRVDAAGLPADDPPLMLGTVNAGQRLAMVWDGRQYVIFGIHAPGIGKVQLQARRVRQLALDQDWFPVAQLANRLGTGTAMDPVVVGKSRLFVAYDQFSDPDTADNQRVRGRFVFTPPLDSMVSDGGAEAGPDGSSGGPDLPAGGGGCSCDVGSTAAGGAPLPLLAVLAASTLARARRR
jgi:hypothetical protein